MDYEKAYNEALERARLFMNQHPTRAEADLMVALFSELAESEDEKIIDEISEFIDGARAFDIDKDVADRWTAWLEKQKEKVVEFDHFKKQKSCDGNCDKCTCYNAGLEIGKDEQKPAEWSEEDEKMLERIIERGQSQIQMFETGLTPEQVSWLKSFRPPLKDKKMKLKILKYLSTRCSSLEFEEVEDYLNNLHSFWKPSKQEMDAFETALKGEFQNGVYPATRLCKLFGELKKLYYNDEIPPSWKPSEEQIYSLGTVVKGYNECTVGSIGYNLKELYEQLKKLM